MNYERAKFDAMNKCPYARASLSNEFFSACKRNYSQCKILNCPRRLI